MQNDLALSLCDGEAESGVLASIHFRCSSQPESRVGVGGALPSSVRGGDVAWHNHALGQRNSRRVQPVVATVCCYADHSCSSHTFAGCANQGSSGGITPPSLAREMDEHRAAGGALDHCSYRRTLQSDD